MNTIQSRRILLAAGAIIILGALLSFAPGGERNFVRSAWERIAGSFVGEPSADTQGGERDVPLYKPALDYEHAVIDAVKRASPSVVSITISKNVPIIERCPYNPFGNLPPEFQDFFGGDVPIFYEQCERGTELREVGSGSGFIVSDDGLVLTNKHVVADASASYTVFTNDGETYDARVLARDPVQDLALLKIEKAGLPTVTLGNSDEIELGQSVVAIGNALGEFRNTVSVGVISGLARDVTASGGGRTESIEGVIQTDAAINPGNSGGPLLNLRGEVIGINTAVVQGAANIGFAIPINQAKRDIESVRATGEIQLPYLGVRYITITEELVGKEKLAVSEGALLRGSESGPAIEKGSPAENAGLKAEDIIKSVNGKKLTEDYPLGRAIADLKVGDTATLRVHRDGKEIAVRAVLAQRNAE